MKILKLIKIIFQSKKTFQSLNHKKIFFYSKESYELFHDYFKEKEIFVYEREIEKIYLRVLIKLFTKFFFKINHRDYINELIRQVDPKFIISIIDNDSFLWDIKKKFPNIKVIILQNGYRYKNNYDNYFDNYFDNFNKKKIYKVDIFFVFNKNISNFYKEFFQSEIIVSGSFANNKSLIEPKKKTKSVLLISEWGPFKKPFHKNSDGYNKFHESCNFFAKFLSDYCLKNEYEFYIMGRPLDIENTKKEVEFYNNFIGSKKWNYIRTKKSRASSYDELDKHEIIASITSTMGYESLSRKNKTIIFNGRHSYSFGFPKKLPNDGPFWTSNYDKNKLTKIMDYLRISDKKTWNTCLEKYLSDLLIYDENNSVVFDRLKKFEDLRKELII